MKQFILGAMLAGTAMAQVSVPVLGYLPDQGTIRQISGVPSSANIGGLLGVGQTFPQIVVAPGGSFALATTTTGTVVVVTLAADGMTFQTASVQGAAAGNLQFSPNGSSALISNGGELQVIGGLPAAPTVVSSANVSYLGAASALAVSDDGQWAAGIFGGAVDAINSGGTAIPLPTPAGVTAIAFFHGNDNLAVTTAVQVLEVSNLGATPTVSTIFGSADTPTPAQAPLALALTADNSFAVLVEPDGGIGQVQLAGGAVTTANCGCKPQGLSGLGGDLFRVNNITNGSVKVYEANSGDVWFVPLEYKPNFRKTDPIRRSAGAQGGQQ